VTIVHINVYRTEKIPIPEGADMMRSPVEVLHGPASSGTEGCGSLSHLVYKGCWEFRHIDFDVIKVLHCGSKKGGAASEYFLAFRDISS
jgi:hypothetical protein